MQLPSHYKNIETYSENANGDKIVSYYLDGDQPTDTCYSLLIKDDWGDTAEIGFHESELAKYEAVLDKLDEARGLK